MLLLPKMIEILVQGLLIVRDAAEAKLKAKFLGRDFYIGMDTALLIVVNLRYRDRSAVNLCVRGAVYHSARQNAYRPLSICWVSHVPAKWSRCSVNEICSVISS